MFIFLSNFFFLNQLRKGQLEKEDLSRIFMM